MPPEMILLAIPVLLICLLGGICIFLILMKLFGKGKHNPEACKEINELINIQQEINFRIKQRFKTLSRVDKELTVGKWGKNVMGKIS